MISSYLYFKSNKTRVLCETGTAFHSREPVLTPGILWDPCCSSWSLPLLPLLIYLSSFCVLFQILPLSLYLPLLIAPSVIGNVYLLPILCSCLVCPILPLSISYPFLIASPFSFYDYLL